MSEIHAVVSARPVPRRIGRHAWAQMVLTEARLTWRDTAGLVVPFGLPVLIMLMNGLGSDRSGVPEFGGLPALDAYVVPLVLVMVVAMLGMVNMPSFLAAYRAYGVLRRLAVTPARPWMVLAAQLVVSLAQAVVGIIFALVVARLMFGIVLPRNLAGALGTLGLAAVAMYAIGMLIAAVAPSVNAAIAIGLASFFAVMALGGGFGPRQNLPEWLADIGGHLPFGAALDALSVSWSGGTPGVGQLVALAGVSLVAGAAAARFFRWQ